MEEELSKKRPVPQQKDISKERRVCDTIGNKKRKERLERQSILKQYFDSAKTRKKGPGTTDPRSSAMATRRK